MCRCRKKPICTFRKTVHWKNGCWRWFPQATIFLRIPQLCGGPRKTLKNCAAVTPCGVNSVYSLFTMPMLNAEISCKNWDSRQPETNMKKDFTNFQKTVNILLLAAIFFAPLKMGTMLLPGMPQTYPDSIFNLLINSMPPAFFPVLSGVLLILSVLAYGIPQTLTPKTATGKLLLMWLFMPALQMRSCQESRWGRC